MPGCCIPLGPLATQPFLPGPSSHLACVTRIKCGKANRKAVLAGTAFGIAMPCNFFPPRPGPAACCPPIGFRQSCELYILFIPFSTTCDMSTTKTGTRTTKTTPRKTTPRQTAAAKSPAKNASARRSMATGKPVAKVSTPKAAQAEPSLKSKAKPAAQAASQVTKPPKTKLVRDSFTMPKAEYQVIDALKARSAKAGRPLKKSEVLRAGVKALAAMSDAAFAAAVADVPALKTGRPKSKKPSAPAQAQ